MRSTGKISLSNSIVDLLVPANQQRAPLQNIFFRVDSFNKYMDNIFIICDSVMELNELLGTFDIARQTTPLTIELNSESVSRSDWAYYKTWSFRQICHFHRVHSVCLFLKTSGQLYLGNLQT